LDSQRFDAIKGRIADSVVSNCDQFREMYEAYALGARDEPERAALEAHLATGCEQCAKAVAEARWLVSQLAYTAPEAAPSDMLKGRLMQTVRSEAKSSPPASGATAPAHIPYWWSAGIAALLLITFYSAWNAHRAQEELRASNERMTARMQEERGVAEQKLAAIEEQMAAMRRENAILTDPAATKIMLMPQKIQAPQLVAMWQHQNGIVVTGQKVPMPPGNHVLQLWLIPKDPGAKPLPSMTLRPDANGRLVMVVAHPPDPSGIKALAITEEPEGGSPQPTSAIRWVGAMT
jgi:anti-sigma-K factor RskA